MPHYVKTGFWTSSAKKYNDYLDLEKLITSTIGPIPNLLAGNNITITGTYPNLIVNTIDPINIIAGANIGVTGTYPDITIAVTGLSGGSGFTVFNLN